MLRLAIAICLLAAVSAISLRREGAGGKCPASSKSCMKVVTAGFASQGHADQMLIFHLSDAHGLMAGPGHFSWINVASQGTTSPSGKCKAIKENLQDRFGTPSTEFKKDAEVSREIAREKQE